MLDTTKFTKEYFKEKLPEIKNERVDKDQAPGKNVLAGDETSIT